MFTSLGSIYKTRPTYEKKKKPISSLINWDALLEAAANGTEALIDWLMIELWWWIGQKLKELMWAAAAVH